MLNVTSFHFIGADNFMLKKRRDDRSWQLYEEIMMFPRNELTSRLVILKILIEDLYQELRHGRQRELVFSLDNVLGDLSEILMSYA